MNSRIDRPVWRGIVNSFKINQSKRSREIQFTASDGLRFLDNQVPLWEIGQEGLNDNLGETPYWLYDAQGFKEIMNLGATKLKLTGSDVGFEKSSNYIETSTQRMQTNSGLPIQMYNNENLIYGPNDIEDYYEGIGILGFQKDASGNTLVHLSSSTHEVTTSTAVDITSTNHNATSITPTAVSGATLTFASGDLAFSAESAKIILKINAANTPYIIICFLFFGAKFAAIRPMIMALSAAITISIKIIWKNIMDCSINLIALY